MKSRKYLRRAPKIFAQNWLPEIRGREVTNNTHIGGKLSRLDSRKCDAVIQGVERQLVEARVNESIAMVFSLAE